MAGSTEFNLARWVDNQRGSMVTVRQASRLLHTHPNTVRRWSDQGIIKAYRIGPRGDRRFMLEDIAVITDRKE